MFQDYPMILQRIILHSWTQINQQQQHQKLDIFKSNHKFWHQECNPAGI